MKGLCLVNEIVDYTSKTLGFLKGILCRCAGGNDSGWRIIYFKGPCCHGQPSTFFPLPHARVTVRVTLAPASA